MRRSWALVVIGLIALSAQGRGYVVDGDADLVADEVDDCLYTPPSTGVDSKGCPLAGDEDRDGIPDVVDACPYSPPRALIDLEGCALDDDFDGVANGLDACPASELGGAVDGTGCARSAASAPARTVPAPRPWSMPEQARQSAPPVSQPAEPPAAVEMPVPPPSARYEAEPPPAPPMPTPELTPSVSDAEVPSFAPSVTMPVPVVAPAAMEITAETRLPEPEAVLPAPAAELISPPLLVEAIPEAPPAIPQLPPLLPALPDPPSRQSPPLQVDPPSFPKVEQAVISEAVEPARPDTPLPADAPKFSDPLFKSIYFGVNNSELTEYSMSKFKHALPDLRKALALHPRMVVELVGHADPQREGRQPQELGQQRSEMMRAYLLAQGFDRKRILVSSRGSREPVVLEGETNRNRRVDVLTYPR